MGIRIKIAACIFLSVHLATSPAFAELKKIPLLFSHYKQHLADNSTINFFEFLTEHYITEDGTDADTAEDMQLPFKSPSAELIIVTAPVLLPAPGVITLNITTASVKAFTGYKQKYLPKLYMSSVWQPPRCC